jgi:glycosyltransferase involved in cell wall biosynthesis
MRIALYAPMNPPSEGSVSGDRTMLGNIMAALRLAGHEPVIVSRLKAYEGAGDEVRQIAIRTQAKTEVQRLLAAGSPLEGCGAWLTYHCYYKNPDYLGPACTGARRMAYAILEASHAQKRETGPFAGPARAARAAIEDAHAVGAITGADLPALTKIVTPQRLHRVHPFIDTAPFSPAAEREAGPVRLLTVAMMRPGKKMANFPVIAETLRGLTDRAWTLSVAGGGDGRGEAEEALAPLGDRVRFLGLVAREAMPALYRAHDILFWPGLREAYGVSYLEAAASGVPGVAYSSLGVPDAVAEGVSGLLAAEGDVTALRDNLARLIGGEALRARLAIAARAWALERRSLKSGAGELGLLIAAAKRARTP